MLSCLALACDASDGPQGSGQTGSLGPSECEQSGECEQRARKALAQLAAPGVAPTLSAARCIEANVILDASSASGPLPHSPTTRTPPCSSRSRVRKARAIGSSSTISARMHRLPAALR